MNVVIARTGKRVESTAWVTLGVAAALALWLVPLPEQTVLWGRIFDAAHVPLFAVLALAARRLSGLWLDPRLRPSAHDLLAAAITLLFAVGTEAVQVVLPRDASARDVLRNVLGIAIGLGLHFATRRGRPASQRAAVGAGALLMFALSFVSLARGLDAYRRRAAAFPEVAVFDPTLAELFVETEGARVRYHDGAAEVTYLAGDEPYPRLEVTEVEPDWSGSSTLGFTVHNPGERSIELSVRAHDRAHDGDYDDRYNGVFTVPTGTHELAVDLDTLASAPAGRRMDLRQMRNLNFFLVRPRVDTRLTIQDVRLR